VRWLSKTADRTDEPASELVAYAVTLTKLSDLSLILERAAAMLGAHGCVLWQMHRALGKPVPLDRGNLFVLAQWFDDGHVHPYYNLPVAKSATGAAVRSAEPVLVRAVEADPRVYPKHEHLTIAGITSFCSVPITLPDGSPGALNAYRRGRAFSSGDVQRATQLGGLVSRAYRALTDQVHVALVNGIVPILDARSTSGDTEPESGDGGDPKPNIRRICDLIGRSFESIETTIVLEVAPRQFEVVATTWNFAFAFKATYSAEGDGLTPWVLARGAPLRIFDLAHFDNERDVIQREYHGLSWSEDEAAAIGAAVRSRLGLVEDEAVPPVSFAAVPIRAADRVIGVLRCTSVLKGPCYFSERDLRLLQVIAAQIALQWQNWADRRDLEAENRAWTALVVGVQKLNKTVERALTQEDPDEGQIFEQGLAVARDAIPGSSTLDVRLRDASTNELYFANTLGGAWDEGDEAVQHARRTKRFPLSSGSPESIGSHVFLEGTPQEFTLFGPSNAAYNGTFPEVTQEICVPISVGMDSVGVLDIRGTGNLPFPRHARIIAELLGQQLGLYHSLVRSRARERSTQAEQIASLNAQNQFFTDLEHQLRSPIMSGHARLRRLIPISRGDPSLSRDLLMIRGLQAKASRVVRNTGLFSALAEGKTVTVRRQEITAQELLKMLIEMCRDSEVLLYPGRRVKHLVEAESFESLDQHGLWADPSLLEQAVSNVVDNAYRYASDRTTVEVRAELRPPSWFSICVADIGTPLTDEDAVRCTQRGYRSAAARSVTGEGSGLGLWITNAIVAAHKGSVRAIPTAADGRTEVRLNLPLGRLGWGE